MDSLSTICFSDKWLIFHKKCLILPTFSITVCILIRASTFIISRHYSSLLKFSTAVSILIGKITIEIYELRIISLVYMASIFLYVIRALWKRFLIICSSKIVKVDSNPAIISYISIISYRYRYKEGDSSNIYINQWRFKVTYNLFLK